MKYLFILIPSLLFFIASTTPSNAEKLEVTPPLIEETIHQPKQPVKREVKQKKMKATTPKKIHSQKIPFKENDIVEFCKNNHEAIREWLLLVISVIGLNLLWRRAKSLDKSIEISEKTADDKAFLDAVTVFESNNDDSRIGAIMALERIATQNPAYTKQIFKLFFGFIRNNSKKGGEGDGPLNAMPVIMEVMEILKSNPFEKLDNEFSLNGSHLENFKFIKTNFKSVSFNNCLLNASEFRISDFTACNFGYSELKKAKFVETKLLGACFNNCDLTSALFFKNEMPDCNFLHAKLIGTRFEKIEKNIFNSIINSLKQAMIIYEGKPLANDEYFHESYDDGLGKSVLDLTKVDLDNHNACYDTGGKYHDTKFPDYVEVIPLAKNRFDLKISGDN